MAFGQPQQNYDFPPVVKKEPSAVEKVQDQLETIDLVCDYLKLREAAQTINDEKTRAGVSEDAALRHKFCEHLSDLLLITDDVEDLKEYVRILNFQAAKN